MIKNIQKSNENLSSLKSEILNGLTSHPKTLPTILLYDALGLKLFDQITHDSDYYLTNEEILTLRENLDDLCDEIGDKTVLVELGCGSLRKTQLILEMLERVLKRNVDYYALDLDFNLLSESLEQLLNDHKKVKINGLNGTYDNFIDYLQGFTTKKMTILWLGSSIGNYARHDAINFLTKLGKNLKPGDRLMIAFDTKRDRDALERAYGHLNGIGTQFIMNALNYVNRVCKQEEENVFDLNKFVYESRVSDDLSYHESLIKCIHAHTIKLNDHDICFELNELIHIEYSYKYTHEDALCIIKESGFVPYRQFMATNSSSLILVAEKPSLLSSIPLPNF